MLLARLLGQGHATSPGTQGTRRGGVSQVPTAIRLEPWQTGGLVQRGTASAVGNHVKFLRGVLIAGVHGHPIERPPAQIR